MAGKTRHWGKAAFAILFFFVVWITNAAIAQETGGTAAVGVVSLLWLWVAAYSITGSVDRIITTCKVALGIQFVGAIFFSAALADPKPHLLSMAVPTIAWLIMFMWANASLAAEKEQPKAVPLCGDVAPIGPVPSVYSDPIILHLNPSPPKSDNIKPIQDNDLPTSGVQSSSPKRGKAKKVIEYSDAAGIAWRSVSELPETYRNQFLDSLEESPSQDAAQLAARLVAAHQKEKRPYDDPAANDALEKARAISKEAEEEFRTVYGFLGSSVAVEDILSRVCAKFANLMSSKTWNKVQISLQYGNFDLAQEELEKFGYRIIFTHGNVSFGGTFVRPDQEDVRFQGRPDLVRFLKEALKEISRKGLVASR